MIELIQQVGPLFWVLGGLSLYGLGVLAERFFYFHRIRINTGDFLRGIGSLIRKRKWTEAQHEAGVMPGPIARVVESVLTRHSLPMTELRVIADEASQLEVFKVEKNIRGLLIVAMLAPLVGVLGTILGLVRFYSQPGVFEGKTPALVLSDAMFEALLTSAMGLIIAIPAYLFYAYLSSRARMIIHEMHRAGVETVYLITDVQQGREQAEPDKKSDK